MSNGELRCGDKVVFLDHMTDTVCEGIVAVILPGNCLRIRLVESYTMSVPLLSYAMSVPLLLVAQTHEELAAKMYDAEIKNYTSKRLRILEDLESVVEGHKAEMDRIGNYFEKPGLETIDEPDDCSDKLTESTL